MKHTSMSDEYTGRAIKSSKYSVIVTDVVAILVKNDVVIVEHEVITVFID